MQQTNNYGLNQWELTDLIKMEDFNGDNSKVDAVLKTLAGQVAGKANSSTVSSLSAVVNTKAAQSDLTAAVNRVTALESGKAEKTALAAEQTARENADATEKAAREAADTALRNENCWVKLGSWTMTQASNTIDLDFALPAGRNVRELVLKCFLASASSSGVYLMANKVSGGYISNMGTDTYMRITGSDADAQWTSIRISRLGTGKALLFHAETATISSGNFGTQSSYTCQKQLPLETLSTIQINTGYLNTQQILAGATFTLYALVD